VGKAASFFGDGVTATVNHVAQVRPLLCIGCHVCVSTKRGKGVVTLQCLLAARLQQAERVRLGRARLQQAERVRLGRAESERGAGHVQAA
jgi:hypothetical protein